jgi:hypothetical protein
MLSLLIPTLDTPQKCCENKRARVVEEVTVHKDVAEHAETVWNSAQ